MGGRHLLYVAILVLSIYAWKDWFISLCGLILMMAFNQHENMPTTMYGIQGLNPWNVLFTAVFLGWLASRRRNGLKWDIPRHLTVLLIIYLAVVMVGVLRALVNPGHLQDYSILDLLSEELINTVKWVLPGILLFDGCRTRRRLITALVCLLLMYLLIAAQIIKHTPREAIGGSVNMERRSRICRKVGFSACDTSTLLAGACWGFLAAAPLLGKRRGVMIIFPVCGLVVLCQSVTGGRAGYVAWAATGLMLCLLKWRKYLILAPVVVMLVPIVFPGVADRMLTGFDRKDVAGQRVTDDYEITSGRTLIWPYVIDKIGESPLVGHGRLAMKRTGLTKQLISDLGESFPHAHNMYLETLLDNGIFGSLPIFVFWGVMVAYSVILFRHENDLCSAVGGSALALMLAQLIAGIGAQHFYPTESTFGVWAAMFLSLRVYLEMKQAQISAVATTSSWGQQIVEIQEAVAVPTSTSQAIS